MRLAIILLLLSCQNSQPKTVTIFAAASVRPALEEIAKQLPLELIISTGPSSMIAQQIHRGAPCDLVLLADQKWMNFLSEKNKIQSESRVNLLKNSLVLVRPRGRILSTRYVIADPDHVPLGRYSKDALMSSKRWREWSSKLLLAPDARTALFWTEQGQAQAAILYASDVLSSKKVEIVEHVNPQYHAAIDYPLAICLGRQAGEVYHYLQSEAARRIFIKHGFKS